MSGCGKGSFGFDITCRECGRNGTELASFTYALRVRPVGAMAEAYCVDGCTVNWNSGCARVEAV